MPHTWASLGLGSRRSLCSAAESLQDQSWQEDQARLHPSSERKTAAAITETPNGKGSGQPL